MAAQRRQLGWRCGTLVPLLFKPATRRVHLTICRVVNRQLTQSAHRTRGLRRRRRGPFLVDAFRVMRSRRSRPPPSHGHISSHPELVDLIDQPHARGSEISRSRASRMASISRARPTSPSRAVP
jgi:hypothetical protein